MVEWVDERYGAFDFETWGKLPEYALQPWRYAKQEFWPTSLVWIDHEHTAYGGLHPDRTTVLRMLTWAIENKITLCGWNLVFDIGVCAAMGFEKEVLKVRWLDGMLLWRHLEVEPEYDETGPSKRKFGLKSCVEQFLPDQAGYNEDVNFGATTPEELEKLHRYNIRDNSFSLILCKLLWSLLNERQQSTALIEAISLPMVAIANTRGMLVDTIACGALGAKLDAVAAKNLKELEWFGVTETIVRSPAKLSALMFDNWKLPVQKENKSAKTGKTTRSTDKNTLHELAIFDPRARQLREYREALVRRKKFVQAPLDSVAYNGDGRAHPLAHVFGTYSSRMTYSSKQKVRVEKKGKIIVDEVSDVDE
jgi:DNA polymerase I-like protein with 3'-5' exonuclease and polymerase domains